MAANSHHIIGLNVLIPEMSSGGFAAAFHGIQPINLNVNCEIPASGENLMNNFSCFHALDGGSAFYKKTAISKSDIEPTILTAPIFFHCG